MSLQFTGFTCSCSQVRQAVPQRWDVVINSCPASPQEVTCSVERISEGLLSVGPSWTGPLAHPHVALDLLGGRSCGRWFLSEQASDSAQRQLDVCKESQGMCPIAASTHVSCVQGHIGTGEVLHHLSLILPWRSGETSTWVGLQLDSFRPDADFLSPQGILLVYDITNRWSFDGIDRWIREIDEVSRPIPSNPVSLGRRHRVPTTVVSTVTGALTCHM